MQFLSLLDSEDDAEDGVLREAGDISESGLASKLFVDSVEAVGQHYGFGLGLCVVDEAFHEINDHSSLPALSPSPLVPGRNTTIGEPEKGVEKL